MAKIRGTNSTWLWAAIARILLGILLLVGGISGAQAFVGTILTVIGVFAIVYGVISIVVLRSLPLAIIEIVIGVLLISFAWTIAWIAFLVIGVYLIAVSIRGLATSHVIIPSILGMLAGVFIVLIGCGVNWAWSFGNIFFYIAGALMVIDGICLLIRLPK